jgi:hypothetical protein
MQPSNREIRIAAGIVLVAGLAACGVAIFAEQLGLGAEAARGEFGWKRISLLTTGGLVAALGLVMIAWPHPWAPVLGYLVHPPEAHLRYLGIGLLGLLGLVLVYTRLNQIDQSLWHDEAHTIINWSSVGLGPILFGEGVYEINNHVLYNLLSWITTTLLGESEALYRVWSVLPGIAAVAVAAWWAWMRLGAVVSIAFAALAVAAPQHLDLVPQARGYGLVLLAATLMLIAADRLVRAYSARTLVGFVGAGLLGIWTLHVFAVAFVAQALALLKSPRLRRPVIAAVVVAGVLSALFYAPVLWDIISEARPRGETISPGEALTLERPIVWFVLPSLVEPFGIDRSRWMGVPLLALMALAIMALWRRGDGDLALLLLVPPLFFNVFIAVSGLTTVPRHQLLLLTHLLILFAIGIAELGRAVVRYRPLKPVAIVAGILAALALSKAPLDRDSQLPFENFQRAAEIVRWTGLSPVVTDSDRPQGLRYYLGEDLLELQPESIEALLCQHRRPLVYIRHVAVSPLAEGYRAAAALDCLPGENAVRVRVPQAGRGRAIDVWIVDPPEAPRRVISDDIENAPVPWYERAITPQEGN